MARSDLPDGVPPDNSAMKTTARFSPAPLGETGGDELAVPVTSIPLFPTAENHAAPPRIDKSLTRIIIDVEDDDDEDDKNKDDDDGAIIHPPHISAQVLIIIAIGFLLAGFAAYALSQDTSMPRCSDQPDWNQYNCQPG